MTPKELPSTMYGFKGLNFLHYGHPKPKHLNTDHEHLTPAKKAEGHPTKDQHQRLNDWGLIIQGVGLDVHLI